MPRVRFLFFLVSTLFVLASAFGQAEPAPPKPQTARQALIEIVTKGGEALEKHLTVEVQDILKSKRNGAAGLAILNSFKPDSGVEAFEAGEVLFAYSDAAEHTKFEVHVDNDDLAGDADSLQLSIHSFRDGKEQNDELSLLSSHFTVLMKLEQNVWRIDKISVDLEIPIGDPKFVESTFLKPPTGEASGVGMVAGVHLSHDPEAPPPPMAPEQTIVLLAAAERSFALEHPDVGFTCSLSDLAPGSKSMGVDPQVTTGSYNGYRFALSGCEGKPTGSFQVIAEPLQANKGAKAFCTDATQNLRESTDGQSGTCLASGKAHNIQNGEDTLYYTGHLKK